MGSSPPRDKPTHYERPSRSKSHQKRRKHRNTRNYQHSMSRNDNRYHQENFKEQAKSNKNLKHNSNKYRNGFSRKRDSEYNSRGNSEHHLSNDGDEQCSCRNSSDCSLDHLQTVDCLLSTVKINGSPVFVNKSHSENARRKYARKPLSSLSPDYVARTPPIPIDCSCSDKYFQNEYTMHSQNYEQRHKVISKKHEKGFHKRSFRRNHRSSRATPKEEPCEGYFTIYEDILNKLQSTHSQIKCLDNLQVNHANIRSRLQREGSSEQPHCTYTNCMQLQRSGETNGQNRDDFRSESSDLSFLPSNSHLDEDDSLLRWGNELRPCEVLPCGLGGCREQNGASHNWPCSGNELRDDHRNELYQSPHQYNNFSNDSSHMSASDLNLQSNRSSIEERYSSFKRREESFPYLKRAEYLGYDSHLNDQSPDSPSFPNDESGGTSKEVSATSKETSGTSKEVSKPSTSHGSEKHKNQEETSLDRRGSKPSEIPTQDFNSNKTQDGKIAFDLGNKETAQRTQYLPSRRELEESIRYKLMEKPEFPTCCCDNAKQRTELYSESESTATKLMYRQGTPRAIRNIPTYDIYAPKQQILENERGHFMDKGVSGSDNVTTQTHFVQDSATAHEPVTEHTYEYENQRSLLEMMQKQKCQAEALEPQYFLHPPTNLPLNYCKRCGSSEYVCDQSSWVLPYPGSRPQWRIIAPGSIARNCSALKSSLKYTNFTQQFQNNNFLENPLVIKCKQHYLNNVLHPGCPCKRRTGCCSSKLSISRSDIQYFKRRTCGSLCAYCDQTMRFPDSLMTQTAPKCIKPHMLYTGYPQLECESLTTQKFSCLPEQHVTIPSIPSTYYSYPPPPSPGNNTCMFSSQGNASQYANCPNPMRPMSNFYNQKLGNVPLNRSLSSPHFSVQESISRPLSDCVNKGKCKHPHCNDGVTQTNTTHRVLQPSLAPSLTPSLTDSLAYSLNAPLSPSWIPSMGSSFVPTGNIQTKTRQHTQSCVAILDRNVICSVNGLPTRIYPRQMKDVTPCTAKSSEFGAYDESLYPTRSDSSVTKICDSFVEDTVRRIHSESSGERFSRRPSTIIEDKEVNSASAPERKFQSKRKRRKSGARRRSSRGSRSSGRRRGQNSFNDGGKRVKLTKTSRPSHKSRKSSTIKRDSTQSREPELASKSTERKNSMQNPTTQPRGGKSRDTRGVPEFDRRFEVPRGAGHKSTYSYYISEASLQLHSETQTIPDRYQSEAPSSGGMSNNDTANFKESKSNHSLNGENRRKWTHREENLPSPETSIHQVRKEGDGSGAERSYLGYTTHSDHELEITSVGRRTNQDAGYYEYRR